MILEHHDNIAAFAGAHVFWWPLQPAFGQRVISVTSAAAAPVVSLVIDKDILVARTFDRDVLVNKEIDVDIIVADIVDRDVISTTAPD